MSSDNEDEPVSAVNSGDAPEFSCLPKGLIFWREYVYKIGRWMKIACDEKRHTIN